jgi:hypothetical protein
MVLAVTGSMQGADERHDETRPRVNTERPTQCQIGKLVGRDLEQPIMRLVLTARMLLRDSVAAPNAPCIPSRSF